MALEAGLVGTDCSGRRAEVPLQAPLVVRQQPVQSPSALAGFHPLRLHFAVQEAGLQERAQRAQQAQPVGRQ